jgi:hypothetical protein
MANESRIAYTVGHAESYDKYIEGDPRPVKKGAYPGYAGGYVWATPTEAQSFLDFALFAGTSNPRDARDYAIYALDLPTGWDTDVSGELHPADGVYRLLNDALITRRVDD